MPQIRKQSPYSNTRIHHRKLDSIRIPVLDSKFDLHHDRFECADATRIYYGGCLVQKNSMGSLVCQQRRAIVQPPVPSEAFQDPWAHLIATQGAGDRSSPVLVEESSNTIPDVDEPESEDWIIDPARSHQPDWHPYERARSGSRRASQAGVS
jgi:hypothetical protein